jgi:hypothetical protein
VTGGLRYHVGVKSRVLLLVTLVATLAVAPGCLVLSLHPAYDDDSLTWDPALLGTWQDADDNASLQIERGDWKSYKIHYTHPIETGVVTGYLTAIGEDRYLDVMPARGEDRGAFMIPAHAILRLHVSDNRLELTPLSYDWFFDRLRERAGFPGISVAMDQKENALITSASPALREWIKRQPRDGKMFGASAVFIRKQ